MTTRIACPEALPAWRELPDLELYMDQVLSLTERWLGADGGARGLTASMVNNYVKLGVLPAPVKKRYGRVHLARLLMICLLKPVLPIASIRALLEEGLRGSTEEDFYTAFCALLEQTRSASGAAAAAIADEPAVKRILHAALRSQTEQALALRELAGLES